MVKNQKGITLIQMVITIVMIVLIAGFSVYNSRNTIIETRISRAYDEINKVKSAVTGLMALNESEIKNIGESVADFSNYPELSAYYVSGDHEYYFLDFKNNGDVIGESLELRNVENNYIVDVKNIDQIRVFLVDGVKIENVKYYSNSEILEKYNEIFAGR